MLSDDSSVAGVFRNPIHKAVFYKVGNRGRKFRSEIWKNQLGSFQLVFCTKNQLRNVFLEIELHGSKEDSFSLNKEWIQRCPIEVKSETCEHKSSLSISNSYMLISPKTRWPKTRLIKAVFYKPGFWPAGFWED